MQGFDAGADDYVAKPVSTYEEVLARMRAAAALRSTGHAQSEADLRTGFAGHPHRPGQRVQAIRSR